MKLKNWIKQIDPIIDCEIWGFDDKEPIFEGSVLHIPWKIIDLEIGRTDSSEEPIYFSSDLGNGRSGIVINVIEE